MKDSLRPVDVIVRVWLEDGADPAEVINEMDYSFDHELIAATEVIDINTEI